MTSGSMPRRLAEMAHARPMGPAPTMTVFSLAPGMSDSQTVAQLGPDAVQQLASLFAENLADVGRVEAGDARFDQHLLEVDLRFLDHRAEWAGDGFALADGEGQEIEVARGVETLRQVFEALSGNLGSHDRSTLLELPCCKTTRRRLLSHMLGAQLPLLSALPFILFLFAIAVLPLFAPHWWHLNRNKAQIAALVSIPVLLYLGLTFGADGRHVLTEKAHEYLGFIVVIGALFVIAGCIHIQGSLAGTPLVNTGVLAIGAVPANLVGTTGASVLLIRPLLRANQRRKRVVHIVIFFIFIVANCGGLLTPIGDPPLLLGFLKGVPFDWTLRLWPQWLALNTALLVLFNFWDEWALDRDEKELPGSQHEQVLVHEPLRVRGAVAMASLIGVLVTIIISGRAALRGRPWPIGVQELLIIALAVLAYLGTSRDNRERNAFTWGPIVEVAVLFAAIFVTM